MEAAIDPIQNLLKTLNIPDIPPHPTLSVLQRGGHVSADIKHLDVNEMQAAEIESAYKDNRHFHKVYSSSPEEQTEACKVLGAHGLDVEQLCGRNSKDLGIGWSKRWSRKEGTPVKGRVLLQCQCGSSSEAKKIKDDSSKARRGLKVNTKEWNRRMPYDFTGCLAHIDVTYCIESLKIIRIVGVLDHNTACEEQGMQRLPPIPLHPHVWQVALQQLNNGASITAIQAHNRYLLGAQLYTGQVGLDETTANVRYLFLPQDSCRLYRTHARLQGVDLLQPPEQNIDNWLNPASPFYKSMVAQAVFYYKARTNSSDRFKACIQTQEMKEAAWTYAHNRQLILDGTFGICDRRILLFIGMALDDKKRGIPIVFLLFSAPSGNRATHAGYDTEILTELLGSWKSALGKAPDGSSFRPKTVITDTDTKERGALIAVWPGIHLLLCKFHTRMAWANKRKTLIKLGKQPDFFKQQVMTRMRSLDMAYLIASDNYELARKLVEAERNYLTMMKTNPETLSAAQKGLEYLDYIMATWMPEELWKSWSHLGRIRASNILGVRVQDVASTTNHLESFNSILKKKYIRSQQHNGKSLRFDLLIFLLATQILPAIFEKRKVETSFYDWLATRFAKYTNGVPLQKQYQLTRATTKKFEFTWWPADAQSNTQDEVSHILKHKRINGYNWLGPYQLMATCASSVEDIRLITHKRYTMVVNCYGWARCSCPAFDRFGYACKHLWAFRVVITHMQTPYVFIFPNSFEDAQTIYSTLFVTDTGNLPNSADPARLALEPPRLIEDSLPPPPTNPLLNPTTDIAEIMETVGTTATLNVDSEEVENNSDECESPDHSDAEILPEVSGCTESDSAQSKAAITHQRNTRLSHDVQAILPRLHGIYSILKDLGPDLSRDLQIQEFLNLTRTIATMQSGLVPETLGEPVAKCSLPASDIVHGQHARKRMVDPTLRAPSPERMQKRKKSTSIF